ncbi:hypothetical protein [Caballeronia sp. ATUFL_F1_KS4A]|uniref:hypothetical protein n=1 Tax=Caballeronia sp. ATUFL_F1_KS4A TaxID=2921768 RepID=UPI002028C078|nr:hypothetical protein [Caballeronia sp. ATUFL_F1_KS4A]
MEKSARTIASFAVAAVLAAGAFSASTAFARTDTNRLVKTLGPDLAKSSYVNKGTAASAVPLKRLVQR